MFYDHNFIIYDRKDTLRAKAKLAWIVVLYYTPLSLWL